MVHRSSLLTDRYGCRATYSNTGGTECYAEFGETGLTTDQPSANAWQNCMFDATPAAGVCVFATGDGNGGLEAGVGDTSTPAECAALVMRVEPTANG